MITGGTSGIRAAVDRRGRLDVLFNNAGAAGTTGGVVEISAAGFDDRMALLVRGVLFGMKHAAPAPVRTRSVAERLQARDDVRLRTCAPVRVVVDLRRVAPNLLRLRRTS